MKVLSHSVLGVMIIALTVMLMINDDQIKFYIGIGAIALLLMRYGMNDQISHAERRYPKS